MLYNHIIIGIKLHTTKVKPNLKLNPYDLNKIKKNLMR